MLEVLDEVADPEFELGILELMVDLFEDDLARGEVDYRLSRLAEGRPPATAHLERFIWGYFHFRGLSRLHPQAGDEYERQTGGWLGSLINDLATRCARPDLIRSQVRYQDPWLFMDGVNHASQDWRLDSSLERPQFVPSPVLTPDLMGCLRVISHAEGLFSVEHTRQLRDVLSLLRQQDPAEREFWCVWGKIPMAGAGVMKPFRQLLREYFQRREAALREERTRAFERVVSVQTADYYLEAQSGIDRCIAELRRRCEPHEGVPTGAPGGDSREVSPPGPSGQGPVEDG